MKQNYYSLNYLILWMMGLSLLSGANLAAQNGDSSFGSSTFDCDENSVIETIVTGLHDTNCASIPNPNQVNEIMAEVWIQSRSCDPLPNSVVINGVNTPFDAEIAGTHVERIYRVRLDGGASQVCVQGVSDCVMSSMALYVERPSGEGASAIITLDVELHENGSDDCANISIPLENASAQRDINVMIPIHEKDNGRSVRAEASAGGVSDVETITSNTSDEAALIELLLNNVPANAASISVEICSPNNNGDSFGVGAVALSTDECTSCDAQLTVNNNGCCPVRLFLWLNSGDEFLQVLEPGQSTNLDFAVGQRFRAIAPNFSNPQFDESILIEECVNQTFNINPVFCATFACPADVTIECDESSNPANTGTPNNNCDAAESSFLDEIVSEGCPVVIERTWTTTLNVSGNTCIPNELAAWNFGDACAVSGDPLLPGLAASSVSRGACSNSFNVSRVRKNNRSSCVQGVFGSPNSAVCVGSQNRDSFNPNDDDITFFDVNFGSGDQGIFSGFCFYERAVDSNENFGFNSPPNRYGIRVLKNNNEIFRQTNINTTEDWTLECFDFSNNSDFEYDGATTFRVQLLGYSPDQDQQDDDLNIWELDEFRILGCCGTIDPSMSTETCVQTISIFDNTAPTLSNTPNDVTVECDDIPAMANVVADDNCSFTTEFTEVSTQVNDGSCDEFEFTITRTWTVTDICDNSDVFVQVIDVIDSSAPELTSNASDMTVECGDNNDNAFQAWLNNNGGADATENCSEVIFTTNPANPTLSDLCGATGEATVTFIASDICGNSSVTIATFTIEDTQAPSLTDASNEVVECDGEGNTAAFAAWLSNNGGATASDECGDVIFSTNPVNPTLSDECAETGDVTVTFIATDECGNSDSTTASFTINDTEGPVITAANQADDLTVECDGLGNTAELQAWLASNGGAIANDVCGDFVWNNDFDALDPDCCNTGAVTVNFTATDDCGNATVTTATFTIEDTTPPVPVCQDITVQITDVASHTVSITPDMIENGSTDACCDDELTFELSQSTFAFEEVGVNPITLTVTDACGNASTCQANVTVVCYDLALNVTLAAGQDEIIFPEEDVTFTITVFNQGTIEANNIVITDYIPAGFTLNDAAWTLSGNTATFNVPGTLQPGQSTTVDITFTAATELTNDQQIINRAEISSSDAPAPFVPVDEDSTADAVEGNDAGGEVNGPTDDTVNNENGDEDDEDPEDVTVNTMSIGSTVFIDNNNNGVQDLNDDDTGIAGVTLELWRDGALVATTTTDANGDYLFDDLAPGDYIVEILADDNFGDGDPLEMFHASSDPTDSADNQQDGDDNGIQAGGDGTDVQSPVITLAPNSEPTNESAQGGDQDAGNDDNGDMTVDFGFIPEFSIGSNVFVDANNNGTRDAGEEGIEGILVEIFSVGPDGIAENGDDVLVGSDVTDANGDYFVGWLRPGDYYGKIDNVSDDYPTSSDDIPSTANPNNDTDGDDNGLQPDGRGAGVWSNVITLSADDEPTNEPGSGGDQDVSEDDDNGNMTLDFGFRPELSIGSNVFVDANDNGVRDADEDGLEGILVEIFNTGADGIAENGDDELVGSDVTDANGDYFVDGLLEGDFYAVINNVSDDYPKSSGDIASSANPNNDTDGDDNGLQAGGPGTGVWSNVITLSVNDEPTNEDGSGGDQDSLDDNNGNMTLDFGFAPQLSIGSNVFYDANDNGMRDADEDGIEGVTVEVFSVGPDGIAENGDDVLVGSDVTDANGDYFVDGLLEGDFYVSIPTVDEDFPLSSGDIASTDNPNNDTDGDDNGLQTGGIGTGVWSNVITLSINDEPTGEPGSGGDQDASDDDNGNMTVDFGFRPELSIGSNVYSDTNNNGVRDAGEEGIEGILVEVFSVGPDGIAENGDDVLVGSDVTDANGDYFVGGLLEGDFYAKIDNVDSDNPTSSTNIASSDDPNNDTDGDDNGLQTGGSGAGVWSNVVTLSINDEPTEEPGSGGDQDATDDNNGNMTLDFGFNRFDLALAKTLSGGEDVRVYPGEDITFDIEVFNQGNVDAFNVLITDFVPAGLTLNDPAWALSGGNATTTIAGPIAAGSSQVVTITFTVATTDAGDLVNVAEITSAEDENGNNPEDVDSTPDADDTNDAGGEVNGPTDDTVNNENGDEDDSDPEDITVEVFDLALIKTLGAGEDDRVYPGETVTFDIEVFNQGTVSASNIVIEDFVPAGLTATGATTLTIAGPLAPGASEVLSIEFTVDAANAGGQLVNVAEITSAEDEFGDNPEDLDSTPDADDTNDAGGEVNGPTDDTLNNENGDEDDSDPEDVFLEIFDLALVKTLAAGEDARVYPGETITFDIEVINQGTVPASNIVVEDFGAAGLTNNGSSTLTIAGPLAPGASETVQVTFTVDADATAGISTNIAEIQSSEDDLGESPNDNDSDEDSDPNNDPTEDNAVDNENGDEDDNDIEDVDIQVFDLALRKTLAAGEDARVYPGETVTFTIEVFNQGTVAASNIVIEDYVPAGLTANGATTLTIAGPIAPGSSESVDISFVVSTVEAGTLENGAEIQSAEDDLGENPEDIDSTPDGDDSNDPTDDNSIDGENGDEDDDDIEPVDVEIFDLASNITLAPGEDDRVYPGETVAFKVTVFNQGTVTAQNIDVTLMIPDGLESVDGIANMDEITFTAPLAPGEMVMQIIEFVVSDDITSAGELVIKEEISSAEDEFGDNPTDIDSTPDEDFTNDAGGVVDSATDDTVDNEQGDEDDNDPENVFVEIFDLALIKTLSAGEDARVYPGETVSFDITVTNQGTVPASDILITDYVPAGLTANGPSVITIAGPLAPGASETVSIEFTVDAAATDASLVNRAEITDFRDDLDEMPEDIDSVPDADDSNDVEVNDEINNGGGDEDDADLEELELEIFDLALIKSLAAGEDARVYPGETITFTLEVLNQGTVPASNIVIEDYVPAGLAATGATSLTIAGPIAPGASESVDISFVVETTDAGTLENGAEIQSAEDDLGENPEDNDSTPDDNPDNDPTTNDAVDNENGDEDDDDIEPIEVEIFDLASNITLAPGEDDRVYPGETVSFKVTVFNQGTVSAENIDVTLMIPDGLTSVDGIVNMGTINFAGPLAPGEMTMQILEFVVGDDITSAGELIIKEEITSAEDEFGANPTDIDSTPDADFTNDAGGIVDSNTDDTVDGENGDEDDNDPENVFVEIFDLALVKTLAAGEDARVYPGDAVTFDITVTNQGTVPATNIVIEDYVPAGLTATSPTTITLTQLLQPGESATVQASFTVDAATAAGSLVNRAEIASSTDDLGDDPEDIDSVEDTDDSNDVEVNDEVNNGGGDEDDADLEELELEIFDLALRKTLAAGEDARVYPGETITFTLEVFNQGSVPASNIVVEDYVPAGLTATGATSLTIAGPIAPGSSETIDVSFVVSTETPGTLENGAEIQDAEDDLGNNPDDNDSTPDGDDTNDVTEDNAIDGENGDEDDDDIEPIEVEVFDLASNITLAPGEDDRVYPGETVSFKVTVFNQGTVSAENIDVTLMIPDGLTSVDGIANMGTITFDGPLAPGEMTMQILEFVVGDDITSAGELVIKEEITSAEDEFGANPTDIDSTPDADFTNDAGGVVDSNTDDTVNGENGDEDDNDPENVFVEIFDLALRKTLAAGEDARVYPGETVTFTLEVFNQGSVPASNIVIEDYVPAGLTATGATSLTIAGPIAPGASASVDVSFVVTTETAGTLENGAEIQSSEDDLGENPEDIDSVEDNDPDNDTTEDNAIDGENGDEDDDDIEPIEVEVFDLASNITLAPGEDDRVYPGETVSFKVTVFNQGTVSAENIDVTLMIPAGLTSVDGIANMETITFDGPLAPGDMTMLILDFVVDADATSAEELIIKSEISSAEDEFGANPADIDSTPDADFTNDAGGIVDSNTDDTVNGENGDEDDNDPENVFLEIFDLALTKTTTNTEIVGPGDDVTFTITVLNQGTVDAQGIEIIDYLPNFLALSGSDTNGWSTGGGVLTNTIAGPLAPGASTSVDVVLTVQEGIMTGTVDNFAEIVAAMDEFGDAPEDVDSTPDADNNNDSLVDNEVNNAGGDEDDHDIETIEVCDGVAPVLAGVPSDILLECSDEIPALPVIGVEITATDFSNDDFTITVEETSTQGLGDACSEFEYTITRVWTVVDECDNSSSATQVITIQDTTAPTINTEATDEVVECDGQGNLAALQAWLASNGGAIAQDNCSDVVWTNNAGPLSDECGMTGSVSVIFTAEDVCGNTSSTSATFTIEDTTAPTIDVAASDELVECDGQGNLAAFQAWLASNGGAIASDVCSDNNVTWTNDAGQISDECGMTGFVNVTFTATDDCGNEATTSATFTIEDTTAPVITDAADQTVECDGQGNTAAFQAWLASNGGATATDECGGVTITNDAGQFSDECGATGFITVNFTATDDCGNVATTSATFTIEDTTAPTITASAADQTVECDGQGNAAAFQAWLASNGGATASDDCGGVTFTNDAGQLSDECGMTGFVNVTFTATDDCGNEATTSATFTIEDTTAPVLDTPAADAVVECDGQGNAAAFQAWLASNGGATASDECGGVTFTNDAGQLSDECGMTGFVNVTFTATDDCGNEVTTSATFTIEDTTAPVITDAADQTVECDGQGNAAAFQAWLASNGGATASDDCGGVTFTNDAGQFSDECGMTGFVNVTFTATDDCGNAATTSATFTIEDTTAPVLDTPAADAVVECDGQGNVAALQAWLASNGGASASDECGGVAFTNDAGQLTDDCGMTGFVNVTFTATDDCGNAVTTSATFTIEDTTAPDVTVEASDLTVECDGQGNLAQLQGWLAANGGANAVDGCGEIVWTNNFNTTSTDCGESGVATVTFTATDECGNQATTTAAFVIEDTTAPVISGVPSDLDVECDQVPPVTLPTVVDACDETVSIQLDEATVAGPCANSFIITRTFTAIDACGNSAVAVQTINVGDTGAPTLSGVPSDIAVECDQIPNFPAQGEVTATDNCDPDVSIETEEIIEAGVCEENFTIIRRWIATDNCGNETIAVQRIEVGDNTAPVLAGVPTNITVECDEVPNTSTPGNVSATDNCDSNVEITYEERREDNGVCEDAFTIVRTWIATDNCGNATSAEQRITVGDNTAPVLVGVPSDIEVECDAIPTATNGNIVATDNCDANVEITFDEIREDGPCENSFVIVRRWTATDNCGNATSEVQRIAVGDNTAPVIAGIPASITIECDEVASATAGNIQVTDNCDPDVEITFEEVRVDNGVCEDNFTIVRTWIATDNCGNVATGEQRVEVGDNTAPVLTGVPSNMEIECNAVAENTANVQATDNCDANVEITFEEVTNNGQCANSFEIIRRWTATDNCGNATTQEQVISVNDNTAPVIAGVPTDVTAECDQVPNTNGANDILVTDNCDPNPLVEFTETTENDGSCENAFVIIRTWTATDACGNVSSAEQRINVGDNTPPVIAGIPSDETVECDAIPAPASNGITAVDNCDPNVSLEFSEATEAGQCANSFVIVRTWIATDNCGNSTVGVQRVSVGDNTAPIISGVEADLSIDCGANPPAAGNVSVTDNCDPNVQLEFDETTGQSTDCASSYTITRTYTATDNCGNVSTAQQIITVEGDNTAPTLVGVPSNINIECQDADNAPIPNVTATDNCDPNVDISFDEIITPGACAGSFTIVRTWIATDDCGNSTVGVQEVSVSDNAAPTLVGVPADVSLDCGGSLPAPANVTATDNCDPNTLVEFTEVIDGQVACQNSYNVTRTWTATDACGNEASASQIITIVGDNTPPTLVGIPNDRTLGCGSVADIPQGMVTAVDNCDTNVEIDFSEINEPGQCPQEFTIVRTWIAIDDCGNSTIGIQRVTIGDSQAPTLLGVPNDISIECGETPQDAPEVTAIDDCSANVEVVFNETSGNDNADCTASFQIVRTWTATDECGNVSTASQTITVGGDTGLPTLVGVPADMNISCEEADNIATPTVTAIDNCDSQVSVVLNEVVNPGNCAGSFTIVRTYTATDDCGNSAVDTQTIYVNDAVAPVIVGVPGDISLECSESPSNNLPNVTATDNCDTNVTLDFEETRNEGSCSNTYTLIRTWTATDACGNVSTATQTVSVGDNEGPTFAEVPADVTISCTELDDIRLPIATDNCSDAVVTFEETTTAGSCAFNSTVVRTFTATDACGNVTTATQTITITDNEAPVCVGVPSDITVYLDGGQSIPGIAQVIASDNCDPNPSVEFTESRTQGCDYTITRTWTVTDACGNADACTQTITVNSVLNAWLEFTRDENCDDANGAAVLAPSNLNYAWSDGGTGSVREDLVDGSYTVTVSDEFACTTVIPVVIGEIGNCGGCVEPVISIANLQDATCGNANGSITLSIDNANDFTYTWIPNIGEGDANVRTGLPGGSYEVIVSDLNFVNCFSKVNFVIGNSDGPDVTDIQVTPATCGESNGTVTIAPAGYTYMWVIDNFQGNTRTNLAAGLYEIAVIDVNNPSCPSLIMVEVPGTSDLNAQANIIAQPTCGQSNGNVQIAVQNGSTGLTYAWNDGATGSNRDNLAAGTYTVVITTAEGCIETLMFTLTNDVAGATITGVQDLTVCFGDEATVNFDVATDAGFAGQPTVTIVDENGVNAVNGNLTAGGYCIMVADANGCIAGQSCFTVSELPLITATATATAVTCNANGAIDLTVSGGLAPYSYAWSNNATSEDLADLAAAQYTVQITDANGCSVALDVVVLDECNGTGNGCELEASATIVAQPTCGNADGAVTINILAGTASTVAWPDGSNELNRTDLAAGGYAVTITDASVANCVSIVSINLSDADDCNGNGGGNGGGNGCGGTLTEMTSDCEGATGFICLDIPKSMYDEYTVAVDGEILDEPSVLACNFTQIIRYDYSVLLDGGFKGPYEIQSWVVNGTIYSGTFQSILEILDFMNEVDPTGNWMIDRDGERLIGGNPDNSYGDFFIDQLSALNSQVQMGVNTGSIAMGSAIGPFVDGVYTITVIEPNATCPDTILLTVTCETPDPGATVTTDAITVNTTVGTALDICTDTTPLANVASMALCGGPQGGSFTESTNGCFTYTPGPGLFAGDSDQLCVTVCDDNGDCVETTVTINILDENAMPCANGLDILGDDLTLMVEDCGAGAALCTSIDVNLNNNFDFYIDGALVNTISTCSNDTLFNYSYFQIAQLGFNGTFTIDSWEVDGDVFTGSFTSPAELAAFLNANDATGNWMLDEARLAIYGGDLSKNYGMINVSGTSGTSLELLLNVEITPNFIAFDLSEGAHTIIATDVTFGCADTLNVIVECLDNPLNNPSWTDTLDLVIELGTDSLFCYPLPDIASVTYNCASDNSGSSDFVVDNNCVLISGNLLGTDVGCFTICDINGVCGELIINTEVMTAGQMAPPIAMDDDTMTIINVTVGTMNVLINDLNINETVEVSVVAQPLFGTVVLNPDNTFTYTPNNGVCDERDEFQYMITTPMGSDIATVFVDILCEEITVMNGFSPNGDGVNDVFTVLGLERFPNNEVIIFNRWGNQVFYKKGYTNNDGWIGTWEGQNLPDGTYFYIINTGEGDEPTSGYVQIQR